MAVGVEFCLKFLRSALKEGEFSAIEWEVPWLQSAHNPGKLKVFLFGQVGLENRGISGWVLWPFPQNYPYSCWCVCKEHKMSCQSALGMKGGNAILRCNRRCNTEVVFHTVIKYVLNTSGFLLFKNPPHQNSWGCKVPMEPLVRGMLLLCFRRKQSFPLPHSHATLHVLAPLLLCECRQA